jgi:hypothetical protein
MCCSGRQSLRSRPDPDVNGGPARRASGANGWKPMPALRSRRSHHLCRPAHRRQRVLTGNTRIVDLNGATVIPGLIESHAHWQSARRSGVDLVGVSTEDGNHAGGEARAGTPREWIVGWGWDEGAWSSHLPTCAS